MPGNGRKGMDDWIERMEGDGNNPSMESREFRIYQEAEEVAKSRNWYEKVAGWAGDVFTAEPFDDVEKKLEQSIRFLNWDVDLNTVTPAAILTSFISFFAVVSLMFIPMSLVLKFLLLLVPVFVFVYMVFHPIIAARRKVINSSGDMILAVLYIVIYMRSSPNMEGAVRFVASNLRGEISKDFKRVLWEVQVGNYRNMRQALEDYKDQWRPYNKDFVESLNVIETALQEGNPQAQKELFEEAIETLLTSTQQRMKEYSRDLKNPVMFIQGMGVLLPVLLMILFPLISAFVGGSGLGVYLFAGYNIILPLLVFGVMQQVLLSRPPTTSTTLLETGNLPKEGHFPLKIGEKRFDMPMWPVSLGIFLVLGFWPLSYYFSVLFGSATLSASPSTLEVLRSLMLPFSVAISFGSYFIMGYYQRAQRKKKIEEVESEFPQALYVLGDALGRGSPVEIAIDDAIRNISGLEITGMFEKISNNIKTMSMTFERAIFDKKHGALNDYPSALIRSILRAIRESSGKGTSIVSSAMKTISNYLKRIAETQRKIEDLMADTISTMSFISYALAPIISGIAVGMGMVITNAFSIIGENFGGVGNVSQGGGSAVSGVGGGSMINPSEIFNFQDALPPEVVQLVVGFYFIQLAFILGIFYTRLSEGKNPAKRNLTIGRILLVGIILYVVTVLIITTIFGGIIGQIGSGL